MGSQPPGRKESVSTKLPRHRRRRRGSRGDFGVHATRTEREIASGRLVRPLAGLAEDVRYVGHNLVFPRSARQRHSLRLFMTWLGMELGLRIEPSF